MTVSVRVNETVVEVTPAIPAEPARWRYDLPLAVAADIIGYVRYGDTLSENKKKAVDKEFSNGAEVPGKPAVPAVTKVEKTYDLIGLTEEQAVFLRDVLYYTARGGNATLYNELYDTLYPAPMR